MENISYIGLSQQLALHHLMEVTANNMANMNTPGFKSQDVLFSEYLNKTEAGEEKKISQVQDYGTYRDTAQGALTQTFNKLDAAIQGNGYFAVQTADGVRYTRNGSFALNSKGVIVTQSGDEVMSSSGGPLTLQTGASQITISESGDVSTEKGAVGKLKLVAFDDEQKLTALGGGLFSAGSAAEQSVSKGTKVEQGMIEGSNVQPVLEMNKMIEILRLYQSAQNMLMNDHDRIRSMIQKLTTT